MDFKNDDEVEGSDTDGTLSAFLDANIILEGRPLHELPWGDIKVDGTILALIVPKAMEEIDAKKRDGRLGQIARAFNQLISSAVISGKPTVIREASPRVELAMAVCNRIPWDDYDELAPDDGDSRIVAEALNARGVDPAHRILISHDMKPLAYARGRDLAVHRASDAWLRQIEPGPKDKEIQRLKQQLTELRKDEPTFKIEIEISDSDPLLIKRFAPLTDEEAASLTSSIKDQNKRKVQRRDALGLGVSYDYDSSYDKRFDAYLAQTVPEFVGNFSRKMELLANQRILTVSVQNVGQIRADHVVIEVATDDGWLNDRIVFVSASGPIPPTPKNRLFDIPGMRSLIPPRVGRHEFEIITEAKRSETLVATCEDFRKGQEFYFAGVVAPTSKTGSLGVTVTVTAHNLRGDRSERVSFDKVIVKEDVRAIADLSQLTVIGEFPTRDAIDAILKSENYEALSWDKTAGEDGDD